MRVRQPMLMLVRAAMLILAAAAALALLGAQVSVEASDAGLTNGTPICGVIDADTSWTLSDSPYLVACNSELATGATLTVEPGVVVKFGQAHLDIFI